MELYIPHTFSNTKAKNPWVNSDCSCAVINRETAHHRYHSQPSAETHVLYISARDYAKYILQRTKNFFINRQCQNLSISNCSRDFWHRPIMSNNFTSSSFPTLLPTLLWMILDIYLEIYIANKTKSNPKKFTSTYVIKKLSQLILVHSI